MSEIRFIFGGIYVASGVFTSAISLFCNMENIYIDSSFRDAKFPTFFIGRVLYPAAKAGIHGVFCIYFLPRWSYDAIHDKRRFLTHEESRFRTLCSLQLYHSIMRKRSCILHTTSHIHSGLHLISKILILNFKMDSFESLLIFNHFKEIYLCGSLFVLFTSYYHNYVNFIGEYPYVDNKIAVVQSLIKGIVMGFLSPIYVPMWIYASRYNKMYFLSYFTPNPSLNYDYPRYRVRKIYDRNNFSYPCWLFLSKDF